MWQAEDIFESALLWLRQNYKQFTFYVERDLVWTLQEHLRLELAAHRIPLCVFNDYPILPGKNRSLSADIALVDDAGRVLLAAEFKYEPAHSRSDILAQKFPVVVWGRKGVGHDVERIQKIISEDRADVALSVFVDEGGAFVHREPHPGSEWISWDGGISVLRARSCKEEAII